MKRNFFQAAVISILLYGSTTRALIKPTEKKLDGNYTIVRRAILNKSCRQQSPKQQLYGHLPPVTKTIKSRWTRHAGHCWRCRDELVRDVVLWTPSHGRSKAGRPARTYILQLGTDTDCSPEDLPGAMDDTEGWLERFKYIHADSVTWWWWWWKTCTVIVARCPWCNGYRCRKWTRWHEFKSWTRLIAFHIALIPLGKVWIQSFSL